MSHPPFADKPDVLERRVLFAVELIDPVTQYRVWQDVTVTPDKITRKPIVNRSGQFVWLFEGTSWPGDITVEPDGIPFEKHTQQGPQRPADLNTATPKERLVTIVLRPTAAYPFDTGATVVRGRLVEDTTVQSLVPVADALVQLAWLDALTGAWNQAPPQVHTGTDGEFAALLQLNAPPPADPDLDRGLLKARVEVTRSGQKRATPLNFPFLPSAADAGRVPEGRLLPSDLTLGWSQLTPI